MSLIGSLEDLGLGDILQIIHLSQKSGVLSVRGECGEGHIVFGDGLVRLASLKGDPEDLRGLLVERDSVDASAFDRAVELAREVGGDLPRALSESGAISRERLDSLLRECVERAAGEMFGWSCGEFSFDVGAEDEYEGSEMLLEVGVNTQFLAMESLRIRDEAVRLAARDSDEPAARAADTDTPGEETDLNFELSAEDLFGATEAPGTEADSAVDVLVAATAERVDHASEMPGEPCRVEGTGSEGNRKVEEPKDAGSGLAIGPESLPPVVVIDAELLILEWVRGSLATSSASVHIFQRSQDGLGRIRQYLARAETPILLVSPTIEGDPLSGIADAADFVRRLREQAPRMQIFWLISEGEGAECPLPVELPTVAHPSLCSLEAGGPVDRFESLAEQVPTTLVERMPQRSCGDDDSCADVAREQSAESAIGSPPPGIERLKAVTQALKGASSRGEALPLVIRFAGESFERVAMLIVRGDQVLGMAQQGIEHAGGPDDVEMRALQFDRCESSWFSEAIESRLPVRAAVRNAGDQRFCDLIGGRAPKDAYVAPIMSADQVVALLYADNGQRAEGSGDTSALEVVLHHAGLALERTALERALAEVDTGS